MHEIFASLIFVSSLGFCFLPKIIQSFKPVKKIYSFITIFSAGFMLGIMLLELMPELKLKHSHHSHSVFQNLKEHAGFLTAGLSFILLLGIDSVILNHNHCENEIANNHDLHTHDKLGTCNVESLKYVNSKLQTFIFVLAISLHSFFEGLVFNGTPSTYEIGIILHKLLESFALGVAVFDTKFSFWHSFSLLIIYSLLTPLGIIIGKQYQKSNEMLECIFNGLAMGSMLFIVCIEMIPTSFHSSEKNLPKILVLSFGFLLTASIILLTHSH